VIAELGPSRGHIGQCTLSSGNKLCCVRALVSLYPTVPASLRCLYSFILHRTPRTQPRDFSRTLLASAHPPLPLLPSFPKPEKTALFRASVSYWFARVCATTNRYWRFFPSHGRANGNRLAVFNFPRVSHIIRNFGNPTALFATLFHAGFSLGLFFDSEDGSDMFLRNVSWISTDYTALYPRRCIYS
jgi:hypothetical protein